MKKKFKGWLAGIAGLLGLALVLLAAIGAHVAGLGQSEAEAAAAAASCPAGGQPGLDPDTAEIARKVKAMLAGSGDVNVPGLDEPTKQIPNAKVIVATGIQKRVPARGQVVALATALQESTLINLDHGDRDSLGLFQQRPSQGWGTREQIMDPVYSSGKFYDGLVKIKDWEQMPVTVAAQKVQRSGFPDAYAKHEPLATALQQAIAPTLGAAPVGPMPGQSGLGGGFGPGRCAGQGAGHVDFGKIPPGSLPEGYQIPANAPMQVQTAIRWALGQLGTMYQWGGSCTNPHGSDPSERCDCSSLTQRAYGVAGKEITRTTYTQIHDGRAVPVGAIAPGDLLFARGTADAPEHVAMAIGYGYVVHAPRTGRPVSVVQQGELGPILVVRRIVG
ncbi:NlpC/P60 family protein [Streptomyces sp. MB09-01]|uniref:C40 family peptidase n=1 Tax=Streptomyces sp. MB09-01 TaxID=3028666 RepID=UPI0029ACE980|nr:NlpC/P60 family protein [Streptomyces sp. MB09-01]MDX3538841.1 NlpC/P60 family protein [Streptomyces sp. MB09-01]MDX3538854.1 NlpC/P60 family protein [Streptomyces sp. MB09-01]